MSNKILDTEQGHWLLAKMGKRVLRPGGKELTVKLLEELRINNQDNIIEFAPGIGFTALKVLEKKPKSYTGIELNEQAANGLRRKLFGNGVDIVVGSASNVSMEDCCADKLYAEAMLTMHANHRKLEIIKEAYRLLRIGGYYGIHELALTPDNISEEDKHTIQQELAKSIRVNARPLTKNEWVNLLEQAGFKIVSINHNAMLLLNWRRILDDEGFLRSLKIGFNILLNRKARKRIFEMKSVFKKYKNNLNAIIIVAKKV